jgi:hypothetical protein
MYLMGTALRSTITAVIAIGKPLAGHGCLRWIWERNMQERFLHIVCNGSDVSTYCVAG